ncbi:MAG: phenylalanine--tRNA ligase subunit beta [Firmicutes bacterium]|nr:phenylalanine--tRNA ligase subunit beta [Bacillota bacterium]
MKLSHRWLARHLKEVPEPAQVASGLLQMGIEVGSVETWGEIYREIELVEVVERRPHPHADLLSLVTVRRALHELVTVVTGANNGFTGDRLWYAPPGTHLPDGRVLETVTMRGIPSPGMLLSAAELGFQDTTGDLWIYHGDLPLGSRFIDEVGGTDTIYELELTPNLAVFDQSVLGIARELAAVLELELTPLSAPLEYRQDPGVAEVKDPLACPVYGLSGFEVAGIQNSPLWMQVLLVAIGLRVIHPVVDVTNFVLWDLGHPMHAFDQQRVVLPIEVRKAAEGEVMILLDGSECQLRADDLVIADQIGPIALAGIMGGQRAAISAETRQVWLESAYFNASGIFLSMRTHRLSTDAAIHFGKGTDPEIVPVAAQATVDILSDCGAMVTKGSSTIIGQMPMRRRIRFQPDRIRSLLGVDWTNQDISQALDRLRFQVDGDWISIPSNRHDVTATEDLCEEVARVIGLDMIPVTVPHSPNVPGARNQEVEFQERLRDLWVESGYCEVVTRPFWSPSRDVVTMADVPDPVRISNPLRAEEEMLRTSLLPHLLEVVGYNRSRRDQPVAIFELAPIYARKQDRAEEPMQLAVAEILDDYPQYPKGLPENLAIYRLKGTLEWVIRRLNLEISTVTDRDLPAFMHPGRSATVLNTEKRTVGFLGELRPRVASRYHAKRIGVLSLFDIHHTKSAISGVVPSPSRYPEVVRDLSLVVPEASTVGTLNRIVLDAHLADLKNLRLIDVFSGQWGRSVTLRMVFQSNTRTLTDSEVDIQMGHAIEILRGQGMMMRER